MSLCKKELNVYGVILFIFLHLNQPYWKSILSYWFHSFIFFSPQSWRRRRPVSGFERRGFLSMLSSMKVIQNSSHKSPLIPLFSTLLSVSFICTLALLLCGTQCYFPIFFSSGFPPYHPFRKVQRCSVYVHDWMDGSAPLQKASVLFCFRLSDWGKTCETRWHLVLVLV